MVRKNLTRKDISKLQNMSSLSRERFLKKRGFKPTLATKADKLPVLRHFSGLSSRVFKRGKETVTSIDMGGVGFRRGKKQIVRNPFLSLREELKLIRIRKKKK